MSAALADASGTSTDPLVRVVIPCYNQADWLGDACASLVNQTYQNWQCMIVNDGSTDDDVWYTCSAWQQEDDRITFASNANQGLSAARNHGASVIIDRQRGDYLLFLDSDDTIEPSYIQTAVNGLEAHPEVDILYPDARFFGVHEDDWTTGPMKLPDLYLGSNVPYCSLMKREVFDKVGGFDRAFSDGYEDWDFWICAMEAGFKAGKLHAPFFNYRIRENSMLSSARGKHDQIVAHMKQKHPEMAEANRTELRTKTVNEPPKRQVVKILVPATAQSGACDALIDLTNQLNACGDYEATMYGPNVYPEGKCDYKPWMMGAGSLKFEPDDIVIATRTEMTARPPVRKTILVSHEKEYFPLAEKDIAWADEIVYLNESHRKWHNLYKKSRIIPNFAPKLAAAAKLREENATSFGKQPESAAIIGRIEPHKRPHIAIGAARADFDGSIRVWGRIEDQDYFRDKVLPLLTGPVEWMGQGDKRKIYSDTAKVYCASKSEVASLVEAECAVLGIEYIALHETEGPDIRPDEEILALWRDLLNG